MPAAKYIYIYIVCNNGLNITYTHIECGVFMQQMVSWLMFHVECSFLMLKLW